MSTKAKRNSLYYLAMAAGVLSLLLWFGPATGADVMLYRAGAETTGKVTSLNCRDHGSFSFRFAVKDSAYLGVGDGGVARPCDGLKLGDGVEVHYLPGHPEVHLAGSPLRYLMGYSLLVAAISLLVPLLIIRGAALVRSAAERDADDEQQGSLPM